MAKKVKKNPRSGQKDKRGSNPLQKDSPEPSVPAGIETVEVVAGKERKVCPHFDKDIDLAKVASKISSAELVKCEDCGLSVSDKKSKKGKGNQGKKKGGSAVDSKSASKAIWVCLECGCFYCGGIGLPTIPQSHAVRHAKQTRHQLAIQYENLRLRWCFPCEALIPIEKNSGSGESSDAFSGIIKVIKERSTDKAWVSVEDVWFGSGSILSEIKSENAPLHFDRICYSVRGLVNLGNTCFFNSVMQNLLAMDRLRNHYLELNESVGPLTVSLKKIFTETVSTSGLRNIINPRSLFGSVCAKAPQFKGFQQHDSHELLRCLLDGLCNEELSASKRISRENGNSVHKEPTFVDASFGGQLSSTVSCLDCGHSSKVFEPFLDLSLPVPTKRPPSGKANQPLSRAKKQKLPPKRNGRYRPKVSKDGGPSASPNIADSSVSDAAPFPLNYAESVAKQPGNAVNDSIGETVVTGTKNEGSPNQIAVQEIEKEPILESAADNSSWLDYLGADFGSNYDDDRTSKCNDIEACYDAEKGNCCQMNESVQECVESSCQVAEGTLTTIGASENLVCSDFIEAGEEVDGHSIVMKVEDGSVHEDIRGKVNLSESAIQNMCSESNCSPENACENEKPLQVQGSEVILLPYKEESCSNSEVVPEESEVPSSAITCEQDSLGFDGFGDLFNEPEVVEGPCVKPRSNDNNTSDSDPDEVDNSDSQVSVESCLAHFIKPELLSISEHGWNCENCSKAIQERKRQYMKKCQKAAEDRKQNGVENSANGSPSGPGSDSSCPTEVETTANGDSIKVVNSKIDGDDANSEKVGPLLEAPNFQDCNGLFQVHSEANASGSSNDIRSADEVGQGESPRSAEGSESEGNGDEEANSESIKVKRDATKRILIQKAPSILTIHLKRFSQDARGRLSKLNGHVDFKETIDLRPYMDPGCQEMDEYKYRLSGVVVHSGTMRGGHYIAYVRGSKKSENGDDSKWYYTSDAQVKQVSLQDVLNCEAYILFYEKI